MPLVHVHGIANRQGRAYRRRERLRDALFQRFALAAIGGGGSDIVLNPYWGGLAGALSHGGASFPGTGGYESFGPAEEEFDEVSALSGLLALEFATGRAVPPERYVLETARRSFTDAVDLLLLAAGAVEHNSSAAELAELASHLLELPDSSGPQDASWLDAADDDRQLLELLRARVGEGPPSEADTDADAESEWESFGWLSDGWAALGRGITGLRRAQSADALAPAVRLLRRLYPHAVPRSMGDIAAYLTHRGTPDAPGPVPARIIEALDAAVAGKIGGLPLVVVAHSLGGVIAYDVLSHFRPDIEVDVLVTVGSQVGLFEELGVLASAGSARPSGCGSNTVPAGIRQWLNVVDLNDPLAFLAGPVFDRVSDYRYTSGAPWAHGAYLRQSSFHARLAGHLEELAR
ncbi:hypothetical protein ACWGHM_30225 [Streptomyces sp. NPDC054904]|uniref:hypothetical protein n=1 Tax=Streptomyces sp. NPDC090054 TaxID=3365933 RepID=UPI003814D92C